MGVFIAYFQIAVIVIPVEEFPPEFIEKPYAISIKEVLEIKQFEILSLVQKNYTNI